MKAKLLVIFLFLSVLQFGAAEPELEEPALSTKIDEPLSMMERARQLYEEWLNRGSEISDKTRAWLEEDLERIGSWEYKIVTIDHSDLKDLEMKQNELGQERWECYWVQPASNQTILYLKRRQVSYLQRVYQADLLRFLPDLGGDGGAPAGN